jgi:hypothetical protein
VVRFTLQSLSSAPNATKVSGFNAVTRTYRKVNVQYNDGAMSGQHFKERTDFGLHGYSLLLESFSFIYVISRHCINSSGYAESNETCRKHVTTETVKQP